MKKIITAFVFCFLCGECFSQAGEWTWMKGDTITNASGVYGVQGVPAPVNTPPGIYEAVSWQDTLGFLWLFGKKNLWKFNPYSNEWTWINGPGVTTNNYGIYNTLGVPSPLNQPGSRGNGVARWYDENGNLWMFGGYGYGVSTSGRLNDMWKYEVSVNMWVWMGGSSSVNQPAVYGMLGIPAASNNPGSRYEAICNWVDVNGNFWLFGGFNSDFNNDLWKYNVVTGEWTWMGGANFTGQVSHYGIQGVPDPTNHPGARCAVGSWTELNGNFWLFGGNGFDTSGVQNCFNDMWKYDFSTSTWTWMHGSKNGSDPGNYGTKCVTDPLNLPQCRYEHLACVKDKCNRFWLFGGGTFQNQSSLDNKNDLWKYLPDLNEWVWISGDNNINATPIFGTIGVPAITNKPGAKKGSVAFIDSLNNIWIFGGTYDVGSGLNDLWKYESDSSCVTCINTSIPELKENNALTVFPNPAHFSVTISFLQRSHYGQSSTNQTFELHIYNTLGKQIYFSKEEITKGKFEKEINVEKWSEGIYFLQVKTKEGNINRKVIINH